MKNFKSSLSIVAIIALLFTSCSKEEATTVNDPENMATLSFGALLNDLTSDRAATKGHVGFLDGVPECSEGTAAYVEIILSRDGVNVVGDDGEGNAYRVDLVAGQMFTQEDAELELAPGNYSLDYFAVFTADGTRIWLAPMGGGDDDNLSNFVDNPLPIAIDLNAGVKKYVEVDVLCYDDRFVNEYGYLFFEIDENEAIKFCIFGNVCPPSDNGRHYPASYSVNVWLGDDATGTVLYTDVYNVTGTYDNGDFYAEPVCFALPDTEGEDEYYFEITIRNSDEYGDVVERVIRRGAITDGIVRSFFDGDDNLEYYHFREGCDGDDNVPIFENPEEDMYYKTCAYPMNGTNSVAFAYFQVSGDVLKATVLGVGVTPNQMHPQHIHGLESGANATCPPASADTNGDGLISIAEGAPFYGGVLLSLDNENGTFPLASADGTYLYQRTFDISGLSISNWENLVVVAHGRMVNGAYVPTLPVACGEVANLNHDE